MTTASGTKSDVRRVRISPLRYPGGKGSLYSTLRGLVRSNNLSQGTYVEPYAGGAGAALALLVTGQVRRIVINDLDPCIYAFWSALVNETERFRRRVLDVELSVAEWVQQKNVYLDSSSSEFELGFATFYLNRTNRSGVLNGGPIGGMDQTGSYKVDARFNRATLAERIRIIGLYASNIRVTNRDGIEVIKRYARRSATFIYADPPYFDKSGSLYLNSFSDEDHAGLAQCLNGYSDARWVLTYDNVSQIQELYSGRTNVLFDLNYSAHRVTKAREMMVFSDALTLPSHLDRVWG